MYAKRGPAGGAGARQSDRALSADRRTGAVLAAWIIRNAADADLASATSPRVRPWNGRLGLGEIA